LKLIIFDLDGTLFQAKPVISRAADADAAQGRYKELVSEAIVEIGRLFPGVFEAVKALREKGHELVVCSRSPDWYIKLVLEHTGISQCFTGHYSSAAYASKAVLFKEILEEFSEAGRQVPAVVVGDTHGDIEAAHDAGLPAIAAMYGYGNKEMLSGADAFAHSAGELLQKICFYMEAGNGEES